MTCDPALATCLPLNSFFLNDPTGVCGPGELGPVCYSDPVSTGNPVDLFAAHAAPAPVATSVPGMVPLFSANPLSAAPLACTALPPSGVDHRLADWSGRLPAELVPYMEPMLRLEAEAGVSVSFRIIQARLSTGETVPQLVFFRTGDTPSIAATGGGGPGAGTPAPRVPTTTGVTVSLFGTSLAIVAYDRLLLQTLVDRHLMPEEARLPVMFTSVMTAHLALNRLGVVTTTPTQGLRAVPTFMGFQILAQLLLERLGMRMDSPVTQLTALTIGAMPFALARQSPALANALAGAGEIPTLAALSEMGAGAATLRVGAIFARALGYIAIVDLGSRVGVWGIGQIVAASSGNYDTNTRLWTLIRMSQDIYNQERFGTVLSGAFGMIWTFFDSVDSMVSSESEAYHTAQVERIRDSLVAGSDEFGNSLHQALTAIIARNTNFSPDGSATPDWAAIERDVRAFYTDERNASNIRRGYDLVNDATAPLTTSGIEGLISIVSDRGEIRNRTEFREHFERRARIGRIDIARRIETRALELGLVEDVNGVRVSRIPTDPAQMEAFRAGLNAAQRDYLDGEGLRLTMELVTLASLERALR